MSLTPDELEARKQGLGGSDAPVVAGLSPWKSPLTLYYEKCGAVPVSDQETEAMEWGNRLEPLIAEAYSEKTGRKIRSQPVRVHPDYPHMLCHIDRQIIGETRGPGILEVKASGEFIEKSWDEGIPDHVYIQVQHNLAVYGYQWASVAVLFGGNKFRYFDVDRDHEIIDYLLVIEAKFWARIRTASPPDITEAVDARDVLKKLYPLDSGKEITVESPQAIAMAQVVIQAKQDEDKAYEANMAAQSWLKNQMKDASICHIPGFGSLSWKTTKPGKELDEDKLQREHPEIYQACQKHKPGHRRFLLKPGKGLVKRDL